MNLAHEAVDRHARWAHGQHLALRWLGKEGSARNFVYDDLARSPARFANVLRYLGMTKGGRAFAFLARIAELYFAALGTLKKTSVFCPLFWQFGPEPVSQRLSRGDAMVLVTAIALYEKKVASLRQRLPQLQHVPLVDGADDSDAGTLSLPKLMSAAADSYVIPPTDPEDMAILHFTSGTTGMPKGAVHVHQAVLIQFATGMFVLDLHGDDVFWCMAYRGWVTGTSYGIFAPLLHGVTNIVDESDFDAERWYRILRDKRVTVWCMASTAIRRLMRMPGEPRRQYDLSHLGLIKTSGDMVGPFEVESALREHPAVAEAGVIAKPEPLIGGLVKAFVTLKAGHEPSDALKLELVGFARKRIGAAVPKEIAFADNLTKTRSGKVMRRLLKARELALPEGETSTLADSSRYGSPSSFHPQPNNEYEANHLVDDAYRGSCRIAALAATGEFSLRHP